MSPRLSSVVSRLRFVLLCALFSPALFAVGLFDRPGCAAALARIERARGQTYRERAAELVLDSEATEEYVRRSVRRRYLLEEFDRATRDDEIASEFFEWVASHGMWEARNAHLRQRWIRELADSIRAETKPHAPLTFAILDHRPPRSLEEVTRAHQMVGLAAAAAFLHEQLSNRFVEDLPHHRKLHEFPISQLRHFALQVERHPRVLLTGLPFESVRLRPAPRDWREGLLGDERLPQPVRDVLAIHLDYERRYGVEAPGFHAKFAWVAVDYFLNPSDN